VSSARPRRAALGLAAGRKRGAKGEQREVPWLARWEEEAEGDRGGAGGGEELWRWSCLALEKERGWPWERRWCSNGAHGRAPVEKGKNEREERENERERSTHSVANA